MKKERKLDSISTFLGTDSYVDGTIEFHGTIRLDGRMKGKISSDDGTLIVGEKAVVQADIRVNSIIVMGQVSGSIDAKERVEVYAPGRVNGDIDAGVISIEPGGIFNGICSMKHKTAAPKKPAVPVKIPAVSALHKDA